MLKYNRNVKISLQTTRKISLTHVPHIISPSNIIFPHIIADPPLPHRKYFLFNYSKNNSQIIPKTNSILPNILYSSTHSPKLRTV
jgi:hypothetical protein